MLFLCVVKVAKKIVRVLNCFQKGKGMTREERQKIYDKAEELWGLIAQYDQAVEEMGELIVAINKYKRKCLYGEYKDNNKVIENLIEEIADVKMCLEQLEAYAGKENVERVFEEKLQKLQGQIVEMSKIKQNKN